MKSPLFTTFLLLLLLVLDPDHTTYAQEASGKKPDKFWHRVTVGGNIGLQFGTITGLVVSPEFRIRIVDQLHIGAGFDYQYLRYKDYYYNPSTDQYSNFNCNVYGGRLFARYYLASLFDDALGNFFGQAEYEYITYTSKYIASGQPPDGSVQDPGGNWFRPGKHTTGVSNLYVGAGYTQNLGRRFSLDLVVLFNLNDSYLSFYGNPLLRLGFGIEL